MLKLFSLCNISVGAISACVILTICILTSAALNINDSCQVTYNNSSVPGTCRRIKDCKCLFDILLSQNITNEEKESLQKSQCGFDATQIDHISKILVCCPAQSNVLPDPGICGQSFSDRIYGGSVTQMDEFPWMALIKYKKPFNDSEIFCGGSLINPRYILSAAHCVNNSKIPETWKLDSVRLGEWNRDTNPDCYVVKGVIRECAPLYVEVGIEKVITHPDYEPDSVNQFHDITLLRLVETVTYTDFVRPICLPVTEKLRCNTFKGIKMDIAGWGATESSSISKKKLKATVSVWETVECAEKFKLLGAVINEENQLCAGGEPLIDTCRGDSGAPLMVNWRIDNRDLFYLAGISSYGAKPCGLAGWPGVYTRVGNYINWIISNLEP